MVLTRKLRRLDDSDWTHLLYHHHHLMGPSEKSVNLTSTGRSVQQWGIGEDGGDRTVVVPKADEPDHHDNADGGGVSPKQHLPSRRPPPLQISL